MIQRKQTLWLIIVAVTAFATSRLVLFEGDLPNGTKLLFNFSSSLLSAIIIIALGLLALLCLFLYKKRKLQFKLSVFGLIFSIGFLFLEYYMTEDFKTDHSILTGSYQLGALLPVLMIVFFFLAARGIYRDEKLVKSMNRLR
ncbi:MAG: DUF4293 domain-containing protein [Chitinophagaceae bacterium]|nr:DUF4293 domain-containing protein [Chitinophagaceae bacterium]